MKFKTAEHNLHTDSNAPDRSLDEENDINLYDELLAFTDLSPEEQKAALNRLSVSALIDSSQHSPVETAEPPALYESQQTNAFDKDNSADFQLAELLRVTGQLADFSAAQDLSLTCEDCGSPAGSEDLFCITCGSPLEEVERAPSLSCGDCGAVVASDEIFCPSCGSAMFGA